MKDNFKKTNIICTIGPASEDKIEDMLKAGMNVARINFSHGGADEQREKIAKFKNAREKLGVSASLLIDLQGPEIRLGRFEEQYKSGIKFNIGDRVVLTPDDILGNPHTLPISYKELYKDVKVGDKILIDDGEVRFEVIEIIDTEICLETKEPGVLKERKGVNAPGTILNLPALKPKDVQDILYGIEEDADYIAASFVRSKEDIKEIRELLDANGGEDIKIIAKIENQQGMDNIAEIIEVSDGIMVARGDLSVEVPLELVPIYQKNIIKYCNIARKPVIIATQMLESMIEHSTPTRAETSDVANAVFDRASCIMLSGESAVGNHPVECVETMSKIAKSVEGNIKYWSRLRLDKQKYPTLDEKSAYITVSSSHNVEADAIMAYTHTGDSVRIISGMGAGCPIFAVTDNIKTYNQLAINWNIFPIYIKHKMPIDDMIEEAIATLKRLHIIEKNDLIYITGGRNFIKEAASSKRLGGLAIF